MATLPGTMRSLVTRKYDFPTGWEVADMPVPTVEDPKQVLIKVHAAGIATGDTQLARGTTKFLLGDVKYGFFFFFRSLVSPLSRK